MHVRVHYVLCTLNVSGICLVFMALFPGLLHHLQYENCRESRE